jgi:HK97 family phage prohead protease
MTQSLAYAPVEIKSFGDGSENAPLGEFKALVSVFGNVDYGGDKVVPGAFAKSVQNMQESGNPLSVYWNHDHDDPFSNIGVVKGIAETPQGLVVDAQLDMDNPKANQVFKLMQQKRISQFSFQYQVNPGGAQQKIATDGTRYRELNDVNLLEVGPCWLGMNPETQLLGTKSEDQDAETPPGDPKPPETPDPDDGNPFKDGFDQSKLKDLVIGIMHDELHSTSVDNPSAGNQQTTGKSHGQLDSWIALQGMIGGTNEITA